MRTRPADVAVSSREHWDAVYSRQAPTEVSWYQPEARVSLDLIRRAAPDLDSPIIDVGGGASTLVDGLLEAGYRDIGVLDVAAAAIARATSRRFGTPSGAAGTSSSRALRPRDRSDAAGWM